VAVASAASAGVTAGTTAAVATDAAQAISVDGDRNAHVSEDATPDAASEMKGDRPDRQASDASTGGTRIVEVSEAVGQQGDDFSAMLMALLIRDALARLWPNLVFVISAIVLVFCSYTLFPFRQHAQLQILGWIYIGFAFAAILTVLVRIKRNGIISRLTSPTPGAPMTWDGKFVLKLAVFGLLPLLTLFAMQFPDLGGLLLRWLEPVQKALP
jgi:hypothetical protein